MRAEHLNDKKNTSINLRIDTGSRALIDSAAELAGQSRSSFMIEAAKKQAEEILLDQKHFLFDEKQWQKFHEELNRSPSSNSNLTKLLGRKPAWG